jgi:hypothetical protein
MINSDLANDIEAEFDTRDYPKDHPAVKNCGFKVGVNIKKIGVMKGERSGEQILEFTGLRS